MDEEEVTAESIIEDSLDMLKYKYAKYGQHIQQNPHFKYFREQIGQVMIQGSYADNYIAKIMKIAGFVVENCEKGESSIKETVILIGNLTREFIRQKDLQEVNVQQICALIAAFVKRGKGFFQIMNTNEESESEVESEENEVKSQSSKKEQLLQSIQQQQKLENENRPEAYHLPTNLEEQKDGSNAQLNGSQMTERNHQDYYYNFDEKKMVQRSKQIEIINAAFETLNSQINQEINQTMINGENNTQVFAYQSFIKSEEEIFILLTKPELQTLEKTHTDIIKEEKEIFLMLINPIQIMLPQTSEQSYEEMFIRNVKPTFEQIEHIHDLMEFKIQNLQPFYKVHDYVLEEKEVHISDPLKAFKADQIIMNGEQQQEQEQNPKNKAVFGIIEQILEHCQDDNEEKNEENENYKVSINPNNLSTHNQNNDQQFLRNEEQIYDQQKSYENHSQNETKEPKKQQILDIRNQTKLSKNFLHHQMKDVNMSSIKANDDVGNMRNSKNLRISRSLSDLKSILKNNNYNFETPQRQLSPQSIPQISAEPKSENENKKSNKLIENISFTEQEQVKIAGLHFQQMFKDFAKQNSRVAGHKLTFDQLGQGYETLVLRDILQLLKTYDIQPRLSKQKLHFLFKKYATMGAYMDWEQFKRMMSNHLGGNIIKVYESFRCYPVQVVMEVKMRSLNHNDPNPRVNWYMTEQQRKERTLSQLKKMITETSLKPIVDKRKLLDEDYKFNLLQRPKLNNKLSEISQNLTTLLSEQQSSRINVPSRNDNIYQNTIRPKRKIQNSKYHHSFMTYEDQSRGHSRIRRYREDLKLPSIKISGLVQVESKNLAIRDFSQR